MSRKFVVLLLATAVASAGLVPLASPAPAANIVPSKAFLDVIANKQPGVILPEINKGITKAVTGQVTEVATSGMSRFLFDKLSGPLAQAGFGFAMSALGLNKLLHLGSPDQAALEEVQAQLKVISAQIQQLQGDLQTTFGAIKQTDLNRDVTTLDGYATTVQKTYRDYFKPMLDDGDTLAKAGEGDPARRNQDHERSHGPHREPGPLLLRMATEVDRRYRSEHALAPRAPSEPYIGDERAGFGDPVRQALPQHRGLSSHPPDLLRGIGDRSHGRVDDDGAMAAQRSGTHQQHRSRECKLVQLGASGVPRQHGGRVRQSAPDDSARRGRRRSRAGYSHQYQKRPDVPAGVRCGRSQLFPGLRGSGFGRRHEGGDEQ